MTGKFINGSMQVKNGIYQAVFSVDGKQIWRSTRIKAVKGNKKKAQQRFEEIRRELENRKPKDNMLFVDFANRWLESRKGRVKETTFVGYTSLMNSSILPYFTEHNLKLSEFKVIHVDDFLKDLKDKKDLELSSIRSIKSILSNIFKEAIRQEIISTNPCTNAVLPVEKKRVRVKSRSF